MSAERHFVNNAYIWDPRRSFMKVKRLFVNMFLFAPGAQGRQSSSVTRGSQAEEAVLTSRVYSWKKHTMHTLFRHWLWMLVSAEQSQPSPTAPWGWALWFNIDFRYNTRKEKQWAQLQRLQHNIGGKEKQIGCKCHFLFHVWVTCPVRYGKAKFSMTWTELIWSNKTMTFKGFDHPNMATKGTWWWSSMRLYHNAFLFSHKSFAFLWETLHSFTNVSQNLAI